MNAPAAPTPGAVVLDEHECRDVFRACLDALTRPGTIHRVATDRHPAHLMPLLALTDLTTPVAVLPGSRTPEEAVEDLRAAAAITHAPVVAVGAARWVLAGAGPVPAQYEELAVGTDEVPQDGAMVVQMVDGLCEGAGAGSLRLTGPGIDGEAGLRVAGLDAEVLDARRALTSGYPRGIDLILVAPDGAIAGLPRTTRIDRLEGADS
ncbi:MAG TPA: phosphonate C-P lyase system protein PhnH [Actinomycetales bacterium]|nr:phosphonate C-P lyase system protein PhnH [Actinomycetales bacterium]